MIPMTAEFNPQRILVIGPAWIGDMVVAHSLFKLLKQQYPQAQLDVAAPAWTLPLLERMPEVAQAISLPFKHGQLALRQRWRLGRSLRAHGYDWAIVVPNSWKSAIVPWAAGIARRTGWVGEQRFGLLNDIRKLDKSALPMMVQRFLALALPKQQSPGQPYPMPALVVDITKVARLQQQYSLQLADTAADKAAPLLVLCPGAEFGPSKRWPVEYFAQVAQQKIVDGWQVVLCGSPKEQAQADYIMQHVPQCVNLVGKTSLGEAIDVMSLADWVVCNDSGLMHIAAALGRKIVAIYGSTPASLYPAFSRLVHSLQLELVCQPCRKRVCPLGHHQCMRDILPAQVIDLLKPTAVRV